MIRNPELAAPRLRQSDDLADLRLLCQCTESTLVKDNHRTTARPQSAPGRDHVECDTHHRIDRAAIQAERPTRLRSADPPARSRSRMATWAGSVAHPNRRALVRTTRSLGRRGRPIAFSKR